jgi:hypothetical protein
LPCKNGFVLTTVLLLLGLLPMLLLPLLLLPGLVA